MLSVSVPRSAAKPIANVPPSTASTSTMLSAATTIDRWRMRSVSRAMTVPASSASAAGTAGTKHSASTSRTPAAAPAPFMA